MGPLEEIRNKLNELTAKSDISSIAKESGLSRNTLESIVDNKVPRDSSLIKLAGGLGGPAYKAKFINRHREHSKVFKSAATVLECRKGDDQEDFSDIKDLLDPIKYKILMFTGCDEGVSESMFGALKLDYAAAVEDLFSRGVITKSGDRYYSNIVFPTDPSIWLMLIRNKLDILLQSAGTVGLEEIAKNVFFAEERLSKEGVILALELVSEFASKYREIKNSYKDEEGMVLTFNAFVAEIRDLDTTRKGN